VGAATVGVVRSGIEESAHLVDVVVADSNRSLVAFAGEPDRTAFARSCMKPLQASVSLSLAPWDFTMTETAVMCASHNAEPVHLAAVRSILSRAGLNEAALRCPPARPMDDLAMAEDPTRRAANSDCSGKHAGMLAASIGQGWSIDTYPDPDHPLQRRVLATVCGALEAEPRSIGVDGCGVPVHALPLSGMAVLYARLLEPDRFGAVGEAVGRAVTAMRAEPYLVAGRNRVDTALMEAVPGLVAKSGAEAMACAAVPGEPAVGVAVKVRDGGSRGAGPVLLETLRLLGVIPAEHPERLVAFLRPEVLGGGRPVGELRTRVPLERP
jgi:L-asparaginase II